MKNDFKKIFFSSLLAVLFIISNLIGLKYTSFSDMIVSVNFITYPFITLCILILLDKYGKKDTYYAIISTIFIQIFVLLSYSLAVNMNSQEIIPDLSTSINNVFTVNEVPLMVSLIGFMLSNYVIVYVFDAFEKIGKKILGVILGTISSLLVYGLIYILICYYNIGQEILVNLILSYLSINVIMAIVVIILFYILKERDCIYTEDDRKKVPVNFSQEQEFTDKTILEVISLKEKNKISETSNIKEKSNKGSKDKKNNKINNKKSSVKGNKKSSSKKSK